jgi:UDP-glucuronate 4-epimerase
MKTILITGVAGFIGSNLGLKLLMDPNNFIVGVDNFDPYYDPKLKVNNLALLEKNPNFKFYQADILDEKALKTIYQNHQIEIVIHLAAMAGVRYSFVEPRKYHLVNVKGTDNVLSIGAAFGIKKFVVASSSSVYGENVKVPFNEDDELTRIISPYANSKREMELLCLLRAKTLLIDIILLRFFTVYGPRMRPDLAIAKFTEAILKDETITQYGDGSSSRDYTFIDDIVAGIEGSMTYLKTHSNVSEIVNLGNSDTILLGEMIKTLEKVLDRKARISYTKMPEGDVKQTYADISKAKRMLDYHPKTSLYQGLTIYCKWVKESKL